MYTVSIFRFDGSVEYRSFKRRRTCLAYCLVIAALRTARDITVDYHLFGIKLWKIV